VAWALLADGVEVVGTDLAFTSDLPMGAGLSSSASLEVAAATALVSLAGVRLEPERLVAACHRAETEAVGAPVGMLDQLAVVHAVRGHATLIDFSSLEVTPVVLTAGPIAVVDTGVRHDTADVGYRSRRAECRAAALALGVTHLADADPREIEGRLDGVLRRRARHVVGEDARVLEVAHRLGRGQPVGDLLGESHESLRDDFEVSCPELDCAVDAALAAGAAGARLTGAGFGGCVVVLGADPDRLDHGVAAAFAARGWRRPAVWAVTPGGGPAQLD
jgi:galactokinase